MPDLQGRVNWKVVYGSLPFAEAIQFFRAKLNLPTRKWDDLLGAAHDRGFVVAGAMQADLLADLKAAVDKAIADGTTLRAFRQDFEKIVAERGWTGWTGEGTKGGRAWRTRVIYDTNLFASYSAGRTQQMQAVADTRPWWRYRHSPASTAPRAEHLAWDGLILRHDDPWFASHTPPNGFGCKCYLETLSDRDLKKQGLAVTPQGQIPYNSTDPKTGLPQGVDKGWDYQPGANRATPLYDLIARKLPALDAPLGAAMWDHLKDAVAMEQQLKLWRLIDVAKTAQQSAGEALVVHAVSPKVVQALTQLGVTLQSSDVWLRDRELIHALRDAKAARGAAVPESVWRDLPRHLAKAAPYLDTQDAALVYAFDLPDGTGKVVVRVNYTEKVRDGGQRVRMTTNFVRTAGVVDPMNIAGDPRYAELK